MANKLISVGANPEKITVIYYGIDVDKFPLIERETDYKKNCAGIHNQLFANI